MSHDPLASHPLTVLLVDDEPDILDSVRALLGGAIAGLRVLTATSGLQGLEVLEREPVDLVVSDFKMPGMDGIEFLQQCRLRHPAVARAMFTAFGNEDLARRAVTDAFASAFISKGADPDQLIQAIKAQLARARAPGPQPEA
jgi:DNA-binding NtrC family response regulator